MSQRFQDRKMQGGGILHIDEPWTPKPKLSLVDQLTEKWQHAEAERDVLAAEVERMNGKYDRAVLQVGAMVAERAALAARCERLRRVVVRFKEYQRSPHPALDMIGMTDEYDRLEAGDLEPPATGAGEEN